MDVIHMYLFLVEQFIFVHIYTVSMRFQSLSPSCLRQNEKSEKTQKIEFSEI